VCIIGNDRGRGEGSGRREERERRRWGAENKIVMEGEETIIMRFQGEVGKKLARIDTVCKKGAIREIGERSRLRRGAREDERLGEKGHNEAAIEPGGN
jgi:hypothetical protein